MRKYLMFKIIVLCFIVIYYYNLMDFKYLKLLGLVSLAMNIVYVYDEFKRSKK